MLKLYQFPISHYSEKVRWALAYKGIKFQKINLLPGPHVKVMLKMTGRSSVPAINDDGKVVFNSADILTYLDQKYPQQLLTPQQPELKQQALDWEKYADEEIGVHVRRICYHYLLDEPHIVRKLFAQDGPWYGPILLKFIFSKLSYKMRKYMQINEQTAKESMSALKVALDKIHQHLDENEFLVGNSFSRADLTVASLLGPMIQSSKYGLQWPTSLPQVLQEYIDSIQAPLAWSSTLYQKYR